MFSGENLEKNKDQAVNPRKSSRNIIILFSAVILIILGSGFFYFAYQHRLFYKFSFEIVSEGCDNDRVVALIKTNKTIVATSTVSIKKTSAETDPDVEKNYSYPGLAFFADKIKVIQFDRDKYSGDINYDLCIGDLCKNLECKIAENANAECLSMSDNKTACNSSVDCFYNNDICSIVDCKIFNFTDCVSYKRSEGNYEKCFWDDKGNSCREKICSDQKSNWDCANTKHRECFWENNACKDFAFEIVVDACDDSRIVSVVKVKKDIVATTKFFLTDKDENSNIQDNFFPKFQFRADKMEVLQMGHKTSQGQISYGLCIGDECKNSECKIGDDRYTECLSLFADRAACESEFNCFYRDNACWVVDCSDFSAESCDSHYQCILDGGKCREKECYDQGNFADCNNFKKEKCVWSNAVCVKDFANFQQNTNTARTNFICMDTDYGKDYYTKGSVTGVSRCIYDGLTQDCKRGRETLTDACSQSGYSVEEYGVEPVLGEFFCGPDGRITINSYLCPKGCKDGVCIGDPLAIEAINMSNNDANVYFDIIANRDVTVHPDEKIMLYVSLGSSGGADFLIRGHNEGYSVLQSTAPGTYGNNIHEGKPMRDKFNYKISVPKDKLFKPGQNYEKIYYWLIWGDLKYKSVNDRGVYSMIGG